MEPESNEAKLNKQKTKRLRQPTTAAPTGGRAYPVEPQALESQQQRLKKAAAAAAIALGVPAAEKIPGKASSEPPPRHPRHSSLHAAPVSETPVPAAQREVTFTLPDFGASEVYLSGEFNGWAGRSLPLSRQADGRWETALSLAPGRYQYKFIIDGTWIPDPLAKENVMNEHGTLNSVVEVLA